MTDQPRVTYAEVRDKRKRILRRVGIAVSTLMVLLVLVTFALIIRNERAHDETRCKFVHESLKTVGVTQVIEERRSCLPDIEERRYLVDRAGDKPFELARKRMPQAKFGVGRYRWTLREDDQNRVILRIEIDGELSSEYFEEDAPHER